jgi:DNA-binding CsgD family transcriptional regulator
MASIQKRSGKGGASRQGAAPHKGQPAEPNATRRLNDNGAHPERLYTLWDELADFPAGASDQALTHLMQTLVGLLKADNAVWIGAVRMAHGDAAARDPLRGWRVRMSRRLVTMPETGEIVRKMIRTQDTNADMTSCALARSAGALRVHRMRDGFVDFAAFRRTPQYRFYYEGLGITDRIWVASPITADAESYFLFDLHRTRRRFSPADAALAGAALRGLKWFQRNLLLSHGLLQADTPLSPIQRKVLALLLTEKSEKEIAHTLSLTPGTTHQYVVDLYRTFRVNSRAGLMALWISAAPPPPTDP